MDRRYAGAAPLSPPPEGAAARPGGLLKLFRRGPPKHPKLNPVGISSKDFFAGAQPVASAPAAPRRQPGTVLYPGTAVLHHHPATTSSLPAAAPPAPPATALPAATLLPAATSLPAAAASSPAADPPFPAYASECFSDGETMQDRSPDPARPGSRRRRGSAWRAKLSFTNTRRPESRRQRHQSFDSNAVDIAAHPHMCAESPLVSLPTAAPASAQPRASAPRSADASPGAGAGHVGAAGSLAAIDRDFLLTIQRNSALEARRQRRRETHRSTMSFLAAHARPAGDKGSAPPQDHHAPAGPPPIGQPDAYCETAVRPPPAASPEPAAAAAAAATASPPKKPRPTSLDYSDAHIAGSSASARSSHDGPRPRAPTSPHRMAPSEIGHAVVKDSVARAAAAAQRPPLLDIPPLGSPAAVPPVPPVPPSPPQPLRLERPATARARKSPGHAPDAHKHRGSISVVPSAMRSPPPDPPGRDQAARLHWYSMAPASAGLPREPPPRREAPAPDPGPSGLARKFSHPEAQLQGVASALSSPANSPSLFSKSAATLSARMSSDSSRSRLRAHEPGSGKLHYGLGRLFSQSPPSRKPQLHHHARGHSPPQGPEPGDPPELPPQPTSPTVSSLVDDPSARRKIRDQLASSMAFDRLLEEDDGFTMAISLTPTVAGTPLAAPRRA
ncbi:hypothetical protein H4R18_003190 [Coemansia javaensis]|uniref:Uncharacterized protein n=1 Tax=Coemansia javaensis TaxID=2761396 RepID=A0A9W8H8P9_9FUNG|nr:hypothetical protein H4R18_003190 [Coemansia javaensis]